MQLSDKQKAFIREPYHRYNIKHGATRSGKTYLDYFMIPMRIRERAGADGLIVLLGNSKGTLQRNVIEPMQTIWGEAMVSSIRSDNTAFMFGEKVHCLGAENIARVDKLRGASIKYCYGDEITTWCEDVFDMLKSRLDKPYSCLDATCNPKEPEHWVKQFMDDPAVDCWNQQYGIDDNPFLDPAVRDSLKREHRGVFYDRYILGLWVAAEGLVFPYFANEKESWLCDIRQDFDAIIIKDGDERRVPFARIVIGADFGETGSKTTVHAVGITAGYDELIVLDEAARPRSSSLDTEDIAIFVADFAASVLRKYGRVSYIFGDSAMPALINRVAALLPERGLPRNICGPCLKTPLEQRPVTVDGLLNSRRLLINRRCEGLIGALSSLRWDEKRPGVPEDKNLGNINDYWDSFNYAWGHWADNFERRE